MQFTPSIFTALLKPIDRRAFKAGVATHRGDFYGKSFNSWEHLVALLFAQFSGATSLRGVETGFNAQAQLHYHLGCQAISRTTLADANARRPVGVFGDVFQRLAGTLDRKTRREAKDVLHLIDATPIMLNRMMDGVACNGRIKGLKLHLLHDLKANCPLSAEITKATVNDILPARGQPLKAGVTYVFDKAYCDFAWWQKINDCGAFFVTRPKTNMNVTVLDDRPLCETRGDGFTVLADQIVGRIPARTAKLKAALATPLRRITIARGNGGVFTIISNDTSRSAVDLASCYKARWKIELLFRWLKQNLNITRFIARNENAVRLQIMAALIAFVLIRIAQAANQSQLTPKRFIELIQSFLHARRPLAKIDKPPPINPSKPKSKLNPNQLILELQ